MSQVHKPLHCLASRRKGVDVVRVHIMVRSGRRSRKNGPCALVRVSLNGCLETRTNGPGDKWEVTTRVERGINQRTWKEESSSIKIDKREPTAMHEIAPEK